MWKSSNMINWDFTTAFSMNMNLIEGMYVCMMHEFLPTTVLESSFKAYYYWIIMLLYNAQ